MVTLPPARLKADVLPLHVTEPAHLLAKCVPKDLAAFGGAVVEQPDAIHPLRLLRLHGEWAKKHGESKRHHDRASPVHHLALCRPP